MTDEMSPIYGVENTLKSLRQTTVTTAIATERMIKEADLNPKNRKQIFQEYFVYFREKKSDPWIYEPAILDNYSIFDDFARSVIERHNYEGEQNIVAHMENPHMIGSILADTEHGSMLSWPGYKEYEWVKYCKSWDEFAQKCVGRDNAGIPILEKSTDVRSRLWLSYATLRNYYNSEINPTFDKLFPQWREKSCHLDGMLLGRDKPITEERLAGRNHYLAQILPFITNPQRKEEAQSIISINPSLLQEGI